MKIGIISAMLEEIEALLKTTTITKTYEEGHRTYYEGTIHNIHVVLVFSRWGKVASAATTTNLIIRHQVTTIIFSGVAGAIDSKLHIGDVIVGQHLYQHDMDASPFFKPFEIPLLNKHYIETNTTIKQELFNASKLFLNQNTIESNLKTEFNITSPKVYIGDIASGDKFIKTTNEVANIKRPLDGVLCVEMEGAAVAQVCFEYDIPFGIVRIISDKANDNSHIDFPKFITEIASNYTRDIISNYLKTISDKT